MQNGETSNLSGIMRRSISRVIFEYGGKVEESPIASATKYPIRRYQERICAQERPEYAANRRGTRYEGKGRSHEKPVERTWLLRAATTSQRRGGCSRQQHNPASKRAEIPTWWRRVKYFADIINRMSTTAPIKDVT